MHTSDFSLSNIFFPAYACGSAFEVDGIEPIVIQVLKPRPLDVRKGGVCDITHIRPVNLPDSLIPLGLLYNIRDMQTSVETEKARQHKNHQTANFEVPHDELLSAATTGEFLKYSAARASTCFYHLPHSTYYSSAFSHGPIA